MGCRLHDYLLKDCELTLAGSFPLVLTVYLFCLQTTPSPPALYPGAIKFLISAQHKELDRINNYVTELQLLSLSKNAFREYRILTASWNRS